jgi:hypothetical protein
MGIYSINEPIAYSDLARELIQLYKASTYAWASNPMRMLLGTIQLGYQKGLQPESVFRLGQ